MKYHALYKCALCGEPIDYLGPLELADVNLYEVASAIINSKKSVIEHIKHDCKDGGTGVAYFAGFKKERDHGVKELHQKVCYGHACFGCVLSEYYCGAKNPGGNCFDWACLNQTKFASLVGWEIIYENFEWTKQEVEDAKSIQRMFGKDNFTHVQKDEDGWPSLMDGDGKDHNVGWCSIGMEKDMFPSLKPGQTVTLDEIIGGAE